MYAIIKDDLVVGRTTQVQSHHLILNTAQFAHLRFNGSTLVDANQLGYTTFYVDGAGIKHITPADDRQAVYCHFSDILTSEDGVWITPAVETESAVEAETAAKTSLTETMQAQCQALSERILEEMDRRMDELAEWRAYRQFVSKIPQQEGFPNQIDWGTPPSQLTQAQDQKSIDQAVK
ncbi:phage tail assembly chaperone [Marinomonas sp. THO17]|uniref:phage tail assembly chaperone n=1 Tax=Marinomonas sp. THO17 TaxID=3149048 RepID=UPI00336BB092